MIELNVVNKLDNNKVLITEKDPHVEKKPTRYYIANEDKADEFIKNRKTLTKLDNFQKVMSGVLAAVGGIHFAARSKFGMIGKIATGVLTAGGVLAGAQYLDKSVDELSQKNNRKRLEVEEITGNEEKVNEALNYKTEE